MRPRCRMLFHSIECELPIVMEAAGARTDLKARLKIIAAPDLTIWKAELFQVLGLLRTLDKAELSKIRS